jgi:hypothetical protein
MVRSLFALILMSVFAISTVYIEGPGLKRDFELRNAQLVPAHDLKVEEARCTAHWWILSNCSIKYTAPQTQAKQFSLYFSVFGTLGGERVQLLRAPDNRVTTDVAMAKLVNRFTSMIVLTCLFAVLAFFAFRRTVEAM